MGLQLQFGGNRTSLISYCPALLFYDYFLTLGDEIKYFWLKKFKISTGLYIACRYALLTNILFLLALGDDVPNLRVRGTASENFLTYREIVKYFLWLVL